MKTRAQKKTDLTFLKEQLTSMDHALLVSFDGLSVEKDGQLRRALREAQLSYKVVKNTLGRLAVEGTPLESLKEHFVGMTAIAYSRNDPVGLAKVLSKFAKENKQLIFKAGVVEGRPISVKEIDSLATLPSKEELVSKLMFVLNAPAQRIATVINAVPRNLAVVVNEISKQKGAAA
ncbi:MAG: 50S ribosomal protein L10 [Acidobacteria bacterium]|nr:50S ribosomal protein L10 [Acidobacteriota bacterium]